MKKFLKALLNNPKHTGPLFSTTLASGLHGDVRRFTDVVALSLPLNDLFLPKALLLCRDSQPSPAEPSLSSPVSR